MIRMQPVTRRTLLKGAAVAPIAGVGALSLSRLTAAQDETVQVGSKDFPEQFILGAMIIALLENEGIATEDRTNLGGTQVAHEALLGGEIDVYPEYTGTSLTVVYGETFPPEGGAATPAATDMATPAAGDSAFSELDIQVYNIVSELYAADGLVLLDQTPFNNNQALAVSREFSEENGITTITELAEWGNENEINISAPVDFVERPDGLAGLQDVYAAGFESAQVLGISPGLKYDAFNSGDANVVLAFGTDAEIQEYDLVVLQDDMSLFPPAHVAPVVRQETADAYPDMPALLNSMIPLLTTEAMVGMNYAVVFEEGSPEDVARQFLVDNGLIAE